MGYIYITIVTGFENIDLLFYNDATRRKTKKYRSFFHVDRPMVSLFLFARPSGTAFAHAAGKHILRMKIDLDVFLVKFVALKGRRAHGERNFSRGRRRLFTYFYVMTRNIFKHFACYSRKRDVSWFSKETYFTKV